jgi:hypothetical protein
MREDPARDHRGAADSLYLPLPGLPTSYEQARSPGDRCSRKGIPPDGDRATSASTRRR